MESLQGTGGQSPGQVGDPLTLKDPCHKQSRTRACRETCPLPGQLREAIGNTHSRDRKHPPTYSTSKALPSKPPSPPVSPCSTQPGRRRAEAATLRPGGHHKQRGRDLQLQPAATISCAYPISCNHVSSRSAPCAAVYSGNC